MSYSHGSKKNAALVQVKTPLMAFVGPAWVILLFFAPKVRAGIHCHFYFDVDRNFKLVLFDCFTEHILDPLLCDDSVDLRSLLLILPCGVCF